MMPSVNHFYTDAANPGVPVELTFASEWLDGSGAAPVASGRMEEIDRIGDRVLLRNPQSGNYWDVRPVHGRWLVEATRDPEARRIFRERRW